MLVPKAREVFVRVVVAGWLAGHGVGVVEDLLEVLDRVAFFDGWCVWSHGEEVSIGKLRTQCYSYCRPT